MPPTRPAKRITTECHQHRQTRALHGLVILLLGCCVGLHRPREPLRPANNIGGCVCADSSHSVDRLRLRSSGAAESGNNGGRRARGTSSDLLRWRRSSEENPRQPSLSGQDAFPAPLLPLRSTTPGTSWLRPSLDYQPGEMQIVGGCRCFAYGAADGAGWSWRGSSFLVGVAPAASLRLSVPSPFPLPWISLYIRNLSFPFALFFAQCIAVVQNCVLLVLLCSCFSLFARLGSSAEK